MPAWTRGTDGVDAVLEYAGVDAQSSITLSGIKQEYAPVFDRVIAWALPRAQSSDKPPVVNDNLFEPGEDGKVYLEGKRAGIPVSPYTQLRSNRILEAGVGLGVVMLAGAFIARRAFSR